MKIYITIFFFIFVTSCSAQSNQGDNTQDSDNSLLWKITGNGLQYDSYLLGTMHAVGCTFLDSIPGFKKAFTSVKQIAIECNTSTMDAQKMVVPQCAYMPQNTTYEALYSANDFQFIDSILRKGNPLYFKYKPMFWCSFFSSMLTYQNIRGKEMSIDRFILMIGKQNKKEIYFMETTEEVNARTTYLDSLRYSLNLQYQAASLKEILQYPDSISISMNLVSQLYKEQSLNGLQAIDSINKESMNISASAIMQNKTVREVEMFQKQYIETIGVVRNDKWMKNILSMIHKDSSLIAVGAMHLIGNNGLITKLRNLGYIVKPIR